MYYFLCILKRNKKKINSICDTYIINLKSIKVLYIYHERFININNKNNKNKRIYIYTLYNKLYISVAFEKCGFFLISTFGFSISICFGFSKTLSTGFGF